MNHLVVLKDLNSLTNIYGPMIAKSYHAVIYPVVYGEADNSSFVISI